ncbi:MAG: hypothetical protein IJI35_14665 [Kiritimatiellae bacterium]|nr:hypothetical protein [Kiritimatiellia bacterium]
MTGMAEVSDAAKQLRVLSWLDGLEDSRKRLSYVRDRLEELDAGMDGLGCVKYRKDGVRVSYMPDKIGAMVAARADARAALTAEAEQLEGRLRDGARLLQAAWSANYGANDPAFAYLVHVYGDGMGAADAARAVGITRWGARAYPRAVAVMVYDSDSARFPPTIGEIVDERGGGYGFGYWTSKGDGNAV